MTAVGSGGCYPNTSTRTKPVTMSARIAKMKKYVGTPNMIADSRMPLRLPHVRMQTITKAIHGLYAALRERRRHRRRARAARHRHRQDIAYQQRRLRGKPRRFAEIIRADDIRAAALRVGIYRLPVAEHKNKQQRNDRAHDVNERVRGKQPHHRQQHHEHFLTCVCHGGDSVAGIDRQPPKHAELFTAQIGVLQGLADKDVAKPVFSFLGNLHPPPVEPFRAAVKIRTLCFPETQRNETVCGRSYTFIRSLTLTRLAVGFGKGSPLSHREYTPKDVP